MEKDLMNNNPNFTINKNPSRDVMDNFYSTCKEIYVEEVESKIPVLSTLAKLRKSELELIERTRLNNLIKEIQEKLNNIDYNKISWTFFNSEEYARIVFDIYEKASKDYREEKLKCYANILVNYCTIEFSNDFYKEGIIEKIARCSVEHILVLNEALCIFKKNIQTNVDNEKGQFEVQDIKIKSLTTENILLCLLDLKSEGLIYELFQFTWGTAIPKIYCITPYGRKFLSLIEDYIL